MKPVSKTKQFRAAISNGSTTRVNRISTVKRAVACLLIFSVFFSGCKKIIAPQNTGDAQAAAGANLKTNTVGDEFTIAVIPDTQIYVETGHNTSPDHWLDYFTAQTQWIADHKTSENIAFTIHVGDIVNDGDLYTVPWLRADTAMKILDVAGVPYGTACGNHEQTPNGIPFSGSTNDGSTTLKYNQYFGVSRVGAKSWYGGTYLAGNNDSHYDLFTAGGLNFVVIFVEYDETLMDNVNLGAWANSVLTTYASRKAIIVTHYTGGPTTPSTFGNQAADLYGRVKAHSNLCMFIGGHVNGEGYRQDTYSGRTVKSFISDYQFRTNGGDGYMRLMKISVANDLISVKTYSPYRQNHSQTPYFETDSDSEFTKPLFHEETTTRKVDFNQDGKSDFSFFNAGVWKVTGMSNVTYGSATQGDLPVPMDYNGDGKTELAVWRPSNFTWYIKLVPEVTAVYGTTGDIPVPADYDGDGKADIAMYRPSSPYHWYIKGQTGYDYGAANVIPVPGDYDGDGKVDLAYYVIATGMWNVKGIKTNYHYGDTGYIPVPGDYNGDGNTDVAIFNPADGVWHLNSAETGMANVTVLTPAAGDIPAPGDYFGDGKTHPAIYRPSNHTLYMYNGGTVTTTVFSGSATGDKLLNLPYHIRKFFFP
ncbi:MAG: FG-GAP-like repeat-containing protein [Bacteroidota bacterium]